MDFHYRMDRMFETGIFQRGQQIETEIKRAQGRQVRASLPENITSEFWWEDKGFEDLRFDCMEGFFIVTTCLIITCILAFILELIVNFVQATQNTETQNSSRRNSLSLGSSSMNTNGKSHF